MKSISQSSKSKLICDYFDEIIPDPKPELIFSNEYELLVAVVLSAQTTDKSVNIVTRELFKKYRSFSDLDKAKENEIKSIIESIGLSHNKTKYLKGIANSLKDKAFPTTRIELESLPGVGRKTANVVLSNLGLDDAFAVDTHVLRVAKRLKIADQNDNPFEVETKLGLLFDKSQFYHLHHQFILFGRYYCTAKRPKCMECKLKSICKFYEKQTI